MAWLKTKGAAILSTVAAMTAATSISVALAGQNGMGQSQQGVTAGEKAPMFTLKDTDGKEHSLEKVLAKDSTKAVVVEWFNPDCPFVVKHHGNNTTMKDLAKKYADQGVVWMAINSGHEGHSTTGIERNKSAIDGWKIAYPVLLDMSGDVGRQYGAKRTPEMYVISKDGTIVYHGAIDNDRSARNLGDINYVDEALSAHLAGETIQTPRTQAYGCTVKYQN